MAHFDAEDENTDATGSRMVDLSPATAIGTGVMGGAALLDGMSRVELTPTTGIGAPVGADRTVSAWVKKKSGGRRAVWRKEVNCAGWALILDDSRLQGRLRTSTVGCPAPVTHEIRSSDGTISQDQWHHVGMVLKRSDSTMTIYLDGDSVGLLTFLDDDGPANQGLAYLGFNQSSGIYLLGDLDEFRIARVARSDAWFELAYENGMGRLLTFGPPESR